MATFSVDDKGTTVTWGDVPKEYESQIEELRLKVVEKACDLDDKLAEKFLNEEEISIPEIKAAIEKVLLKEKLLLAFCGSAFKNKGVQLMLDAVGDYLPSPMDVPAVQSSDGTETKYLQ